MNTWEGSVYNMSKTFNAQSKFNKFDKQNKPEPQNPGGGRPRLAPGEKLRGYRYNLNLDRDLKQYLHEIAWQNRTSITQYINDLIRKDMEEYFANGGTTEGWETDER